MEIENMGMFPVRLLQLRSKSSKGGDPSSNGSRSVCFAGKLSVKIIFHIFQCLVTQKRISQRKTIFSQRKTLIKIKLIFYRLFSKIFFWKTISLSCVAFLINIIFICSCGKHNFLAPSLSHGKFSHFFSPQSSHSHCH